MGRRALRPLPRDLDLSRHYLEQIKPGRPTLDVADQRAALTECLRQLGRGPLEIEVGTGKGLFLANAAAALPDHRFLGIEVARKYARHAASRLAKAKLPNAVVLQADAQRVVADLPSDSVRAVHIYFPDPWWKKRHRKRRIMNGPFLCQVHRVLESGGMLHFWTDVRDYFLEAMQVIANETPLDDLIVPEESPAHHDLDYRTHFERRVRKHGQTVYRALYRKE